MTTTTNSHSGQIKTKKRVSDHGEVFTAPAQVNAMLDLVKDQTERIDARFLEPACGNGNFLAEILKRKLAVVGNKFKESQGEYELNAFIAIANIYGIDILFDNVLECRERLYKIFNIEYTKLFQDKCQDALRVSIQHLLSLNILWGDALSLRTPNEEALPITFAEWTSVGNDLIKRRDYLLSFLLDKSMQLSLFSDDNNHAYIPMPVKEYGVVSFLNMTNAEPE